MIEIAVNQIRMDKYHRRFSVTFIHTPTPTKNIQFIDIDTMDGDNIDIDNNYYGGHFYWDNQPEN